MFEGDSSDEDFTPPPPPSLVPTTVDNDDEAGASPRADAGVSPDADADACADPDADADADGSPTGSAMDVPHIPHVPHRGKGPMALAAAKRRRLDGGELKQFDAPVLVLGPTATLPGQVAAARYAVPTHAPTVQVSLASGSAQVCTAMVWRALVKKFKALLDGTTSKKRPHPFLAGVERLSPSAVLNVIRLVYDVVPTADGEDILQTVNHSGRMVFAVRWPSSDTFPCDADVAYFVVDTTGSGAGVAFVYRNAVMFVQGPAAADNDPLALATTVGELRGLTPSAICLLQLFCDLVGKVSVSNHRRGCHRIELNVTVNTPAGGEVDAVYTRAAAEFSAGVLGTMYARTMKAPSAKKPTVVYNRAAAEDACAAPVASPSQALRKPTPAVLEGLASLCDTLRYKAMTGAAIKNKVFLWARMADVNLDRTTSGAPPAALGTPGYTASVEDALTTMVSFILSRHWDEDVIYDLESDMA